MSCQEVLNPKSNRKVGWNNRTAVHLKEKYFLQSTAMISLKMLTSNQQDHISVVTLNIKHRNERREISDSTFCLVLAEKLFVSCWRKWRTEIREKVSHLTTNRLVGVVWNDLVAELCPLCLASWKFSNVDAVQCFRTAQKLRYLASMNEFQAY